MKPCAKNREPIALLAMRNLPGGEAGKLRAHLAECPGCAAHAEELARFCGPHAADPTLGEANPSPDFHRKLSARIRGEADARATPGPTNGGAGIAFWRIPLAAAAMVAAMIFFLPPAPMDPKPDAPGSAARPTSAGKRLPSPRLANYYAAIHRSPEALDLFLSSQAGEGGGGEGSINFAALVE